jgi:hypothetical protein
MHKHSQGPFTLCGEGGCPTQQSVNRNLDKAPLHGAFFDTNVGMIYSSKYCN